jgi:hypothetical protein
MRTWRSGCGANGWQKKAVVPHWKAVLALAEMRDLSDQESGALGDGNCVYLGKFVAVVSARRKQNVVKSRFVRK